MGRLAKLEATKRSSPAAPTKLYPVGTKFTKSGQPIPPPPPPVAKPVQEVAPAGAHPAASPKTGVVDETWSVAAVAGRVPSRVSTPGKSKYQDTTVGDVKICW